MNQVITDTFQETLEDKVIKPQKIKYSKSELDTDVNSLNWNINNTKTKITIYLKLYQYVVVDTGLCSGNLVGLSSDIGEVVEYSKEYDLNITDVKHVTIAILGTTYILDNNDNITVTTKVMFTITDVT